MLLLPFVLLLGCMALGPVLAPRWWARHYAKVALGLGAIIAGIYLFVLRDTATLGHAAHEYISFIALIGSLFVVSGSILIRIDIEATPAANALFLFVGALAANVLGTTGAAMLLIRPWLRMNQGRIRPYHTVFFIFIVANAGGCLTPIGDPPLFLGYLEGIPFWWTLQHSWMAWITANGLLLAIFYAIDARWPHQNPSPQPSPRLGGERESDIVPKSKPKTRCWQFGGGWNLVFLAVILGAVFVNGRHFEREILMLAAAIGSYFTTPKRVHAANGFNFHPVQEVAALFAGIFATMPPVLAWLDKHAVSMLGHNPSPGTFFWSTGSLSAVLDNAPTFLGFLSALRGGSGSLDMPSLLAQNPVQLLAISLGAVFFGAATYIGNGPNFMVRSVAEQSNAQPPSFLEFVLKYTLPFLVPMLAVVWWMFFRG